jgi:DNA invertase Pin-like site-specific DNA recombinase
MAGLKHYIGFARVSSKVQRQEGFSIAVQRDRIQAWVKAQGGVVDRIWEVAESASDENARAKYHEMLDYARGAAKTLSGIVFTTVDRATRNLSDLAEFEKLKAGYGLVAYFVDDGINTGEDDLLEFMLRGVIAINKKQVDRKKVIASQIRRVEEGHFHSLAPYGYENYRKDRRGLVRVLPDRAAIVRRIFDLYAWRGYTLARIADLFHAEGLRFTEKRPTWHPSTLSKILLNRAYIGEVPFKGQWFPGNHEALIDRTTFDRVQTLLGRKQYTDHAHLFGTRMLTCGRCGNSITGYVATKYKDSDRVSDYTYYFCGGCRRAKSGKQVRQVVLEAQVLALFDRMRINDDEVRGWFVDVIKEKAKASSAAAIDQLKALRKQLGVLDAKQSRLLEMRMAEEIDATGYARKSTELRDERARVQERIDVLSRSNDEATDLAIQVFELSQALRARWDTSNYSARRGLLQILSLNWKLDGVTLVPELRRPFDRLIEGPLIHSGRTERI